MITYQVVLIYSQYTTQNASFSVMHESYQVSLSRYVYGYIANDGVYYLAVDIMRNS